MLFPLPLIPQKPGQCQGRIVSATSLRATADGAGRGRPRTGCHILLGLCRAEAILGIWGDSRYSSRGKDGEWGQIHPDSMHELMMETGKYQ